MRLPAIVEAKPHCGLRASRSSGISRAASWMRPRSSSTDSTFGFFVVTSPRTTIRSSGTARSGSKPPERSSSYSRRKRWNRARLNTRAIGSYAYYSPRFTDGGQLQWSGAGSGLVDDFGVVLEPRNGSRFPPYHRLDLSLRKTFTKGWGTLTPYVNVLNVYNRRNPLFYFFEYDHSPAVRSGVSMFPVLPTFGLEVTF